ncbi:MAG: 2OG-Fe(II) oxygenase family protein [Pseudomonadales bacterium]|nr:2OG-Fe(II) oxygenase family protein [Pseudomonadales bacterium]
MINLINPNLDRAAIREEMERSGFVQIDNFFAEEVAEAIFQSLDTQVKWDLAYSRNSQGQLIKAGDLSRMSPQDIRQAVSSAFDFSRDRFQFVYNTFKVIDSYLAAEYRRHYLYELADAFHGRDYLAFVRELSGCPAIVRMNIFAARYLPGHFLTPHDDSHVDEGREVTYILNLTKAWRPEWGGLLHIMDADQQSINRTIVPAFNSMVLFRPPRWHFVSQVSNYAKRPRYTVTGWMLNK